MTDVPDCVPVFVVAGGPSGLAAAVELGRRGIEALVVEPRNDLDQLRPRAKTTSVLTMEHLRRWGIADADGTAGRLMRSDVAHRLAVTKGELHSLGLVLGSDYPSRPPSSWTGARCRSRS